MTEPKTKENPKGNGAEVLTEFVLRAEDEITGGAIDELIQVGYLKSDGTLDLTKQKEWNATLLATVYKGLTKEAAMKIPFKDRNNMLEKARKVLQLTTPVKPDVGGKTENFTQ